jgi:uncharacterized protein YbjT (DUF2867 family)
MKMTEKSALVFGGSGLVGRSLINELIISEDYMIIRVFSRNRSIGFSDTRIREYIVDFENPETFSENVTGDDMFICLGTTIKKAGSIKRMEEIDRDLPVTLASLAKSNGVKRLAVVSSIGANSGSSNYYLRIKGEMEDAILEKGFGKVAIVRPSILLGERGEKRLGESAGKFFMRIFGVFLYGSFRKYRAIEARDVARAMIRILSQDTGEKIFESDQLQEIADQN